MEPTRRDFLERAALGAAGVGGLSPLIIDHLDLAIGRTRRAAPGEWDLSWTKRLTGRNKAVFDVPEVDSGYGVWRASIWGRQYQDVLGAKPEDISTVIVLRHNGIALAMTQPFWDTYAIGKHKSALHPITQQPTDRNPALLSSAVDKQYPPDFDAFTLDKAIGRGVVVLACNLALRDCIELIQKQDGSNDEAARKRAISFLIPGVILQPSGVFAAVLAQQSGCSYVRAS